MEDCYYFLYSSCKLKDKCMYRHNEDCRNNLVTCRNWKCKKTCRVDCPFRHSEYHLKRSRDREMCYWETKPSGCTKARCEYKHLDPAKDSWKGTKTEDAVAHDDGLAADGGTDSTRLEDYEDVAKLQSPRDTAGVDVPVDEGVRETSEEPQEDGDRPDGVEKDEDRPCTDDIVPEASNRGTEEEMGPDTVQLPTETGARQSAPESDTDHDSIKRIKTSSHTDRVAAGDDIDLEELDREIEELDDIVIK